MASKSVAEQLRHLGILLILSAAICWSLPEASAAEPVAMVVQQRGMATVQRAEYKAHLAIGAPLYRADRIITGDKARVKLRLDDGSTVVVGSNSQVAIAEFAKSKSRLDAVLSLLRGIVRATVAKGAAMSRFDVRTRAAVASSRFTVFGVEATPDKTSVLVVEGRVVVETARPDEAVTLNPGDGTDVPLGGAPSPAKKWGQKRVAAFLERTELP